MSQKSSRLDGVAFTILLVLILWAPWPLGSNRPWAIGFLAVFAWSAVLLSVASRLRHGFATGSKYNLMGTSLIPLGSVAGFALLLSAQLITGLGADGGTISIDRFHTRLYLLTSLIYLGAWLLVILTVTTRERATQLLGAVLGAGVLQALAAVLLYSSAGHYEYLFTTFDQGSRAMGTFPNPDHLAGYMELCLSAGLGWLLSQFKVTERQGSDGGWQSNVAGFLGFVMSGKMLLRLLMVILVIALVMTHSRMGNGAFFLALTISGGVVAAASKQLRRPALWLVASMTLVDVFIIGQWVGLDRVIQRMQDTPQSNVAPSGFGSNEPMPQREESLQQRMLIPRLSLELAAQRPWFGHGGGTFSTAFPAIKKSDEVGQREYWDHAHNDYVQVACDTGIVGLALWLIPAVATLWRAVRLLSDRQSRENRGFAVAALMALCAMGLHSFVDFNMHIPANALTLTVLLAAVWALPTAQKRRRLRGARGASAAPAAS